MLKLLQSISAALVLAGVSAGVARADRYDDTIHTFKQAGKSSTFFAKAYGYAVFPTVGGAGFLIGAAHGKGCGGLMYAATISGQRFTYTPRGGN